MSKAPKTRFLEMTRRDRFAIEIYCSPNIQKLYLSSNDVCDALGLTRVAGADVRPAEDFVRARCIFAVREADALIAALDET